MHMHDTECKINLGIIKNKKTRRNPSFPRKYFLALKYIGSEQYGYSFATGISPVVYIDNEKAAVYWSFAVLTFWPWLCEVCQFYCLGVMIDIQLSWHAQVDRAKTSFPKKVGTLRRMSYLPKSILEEIYFKTIIPIVTYGILV